jgi:hypothetical protein
MPAMISDLDARYAFDIVKGVCETIGPGLPGTSQERARALIIKKELEKHLGAENVKIEEFSFSPGSFLGNQRLGALSTLLAALLNLIVGSAFDPPSWGMVVAAALSLVFSVLPVLLFIFQFILAREVIDPLFKQETSINVIGALRRPGTHTVRRLLILGGHHDSAWEDTLLHRLGYGFFFATLTLFLGLIVMPVMCIIQLAGVIARDAAIIHAATLKWLMLIYPIVPSIVFGLFWHRAGKNGGLVPGAVDNLSASALVVAMCAFLEEHPAFIPEDTEIRFISFGSEEAGLRGSRRYLKRHLDELKRLDARLLNYEMVAFPEIAIITSDRNGTVKNDPEMVKSVRTAAERAGVPHQVKPASFGTCTDATPFSEAGLKALALVPFQFPQQFVGCYHQRSDTPDKVTIEPLENVLKLTLEWIRCGGE